MDGVDPPGSPYRAAGAPLPKVEPDVAAALGAERSVHRAAIGAALILPLFTVATILLVGAAMTPALGLTAWMIVLPFAFAGGALFGSGPYRLRSARVVLHQRGLVVTLRGRRDVIAFDDVREVWWDGVSRGPYFARVAALRLTDDRGRSHTVPLLVERGNDVMRWVDRHCSLCLLPDARTALQNGETLTFGRVSFDSQGIVFGTVRVAWSRIRLVRMLPGQVALFQWMPVFPWTTIRLDRVPHPGLFVRLLREAAPKVGTWPRVPDA
jgi:hypothetical protein